MRTAGNHPADVGAGRAVRREASIATPTASAVRAIVVSAHGRERVESAWMLAPALGRRAGMVPVPAL